VEYRAITNGKRKRKEKTRLIDALTYYQLDHIGSVEKGEMQQLAMRGGPYSKSERAGLLGDCETDVDALLALLNSHMARDMEAFHLEEMLFRGRSMVAQTRSDCTGIWVDTEVMEAIHDNRELIHLRVIESYENSFKWGIFDNGHFSYNEYVKWLGNNNIRLPL